jgi:hypothetical protein
MATAALDASFAVLFDKEVPTRRKMSTQGVGTTVGGMRRPERAIPVGDAFVVAMRHYDR